MSVKLVFGGLVKGEALAVSGWGGEVSSVVSGSWHVKQGRLELGSVSFIDWVDVVHLQMPVTYMSLSVW